MCTVDLYWTVLNPTKQVILRRKQCKQSSWIQVYYSVIFSLIKLVSFNVISWWKIHRTKLRKFCRWFATDFRRVRKRQKIYVTTTRWKRQKTRHRRLRRLPRRRRSQQNRLSRPIRLSRPRLKAGSGRISWSPGWSSCPGRRGTHRRIPSPGCSHTEPGHRF